MDFTPNEVMQYLEELQIPEKKRTRYKAMLKEHRYEELYTALRGVRLGFLEDVHQSQRRLDHLDHLIYDIKKKK